MKNIFKIAIRNLLRYKRRTLMTSLLIIIGIVLVIVFSGVSVSFKSMIIGSITDSMLGHLQIHKSGYVSSIDNLPLHLNINENGIRQLDKIFEKHNDVIEAYSYRIKFNSMLSNFVETTNIRLTAVEPQMENSACPRLVERIIDGVPDPNTFVKPGEIIIPENLSKGLNLKMDEEVVLVANNKDGSVNGLSLKVSHIIEGLLGPSGRDGFIHIDDAKVLLRINDNEINEVAIRLKNPDNLGRVNKMLNDELSQIKNKQDKPAFELHTWADLSPFSTIATIVDLLIITVKIVLIAIVLISILNVMMMSVYERVSEIGTISAIGTLPSKILWLFMAEGLSLGVFSAVIGDMIGVLVLLIINIAKIHFSFGRIQNILLNTSISASELISVSLIVIIIAVISSLQPALKASKMQPVDALKHV
ncbi:MAG: ABC transporter substrate-binding protein [Candidatus Marinimicrobia bacterium CG08_land_8_20_14_0_20_45_22]|nr:MAG: ABC transporter substrate-binding protein [Candidatus Marinimicrobia bacterium CG08_land_8_20_14_0_20_45_22]